MKNIKSILAIGLLLFGMNAIAKDFKVRDGCQAMPCRAASTLSTTD